MSIFTIADVAKLKQDRLLRVANSLFPDVMPSDEYLFEKLQAEEVSLEQRFRTNFSVREVLPTGADPAEQAAFPEGTLFLEEPGYDYEPRLFEGESWGLIVLRNRPIVAIHSIRFAYPSITSSLYEVPKAWIRFERKLGRVNLVPATDSVVTFPANAFIMSALSGGRTIPLMMQVRYSTGFVDIRKERPDIVDALLRATVLSVLDDQFLPTSGSDSIDGLSQSLSFDAGKHRELLDARLDRIASSLQGIQVAFL